MTAPRELPLPDAALEDPEGHEFLRVWKTEQATHFVVNQYYWRDPLVWGIVLADLAWDIAGAFANAEVMDAQSALAELRQGLEAEWKDPTAESTPGRL